MIANELDPKLEVVITLGERATVDKAFAGAGINDVTIVDAKK